MVVELEELVSKEELVTAVLEEALASVSAIVCVDLVGVGLAATELDLLDVSHRGNVRKRRYNKEICDIDWGRS